VYWLVAHDVHICIYFLKNTDPRICDFIRFIFKAEMISNNIQYVNDFFVMVGIEINIFLGFYVIIKANERKNSKIFL